MQNDGHLGRIENCYKKMSKNRIAVIHWIV